MSDEHLGRVIDELLAAQEAILDDEQISEAKAKLQRCWRKMARDRRYLQRVLGMDDDEEVEFFSYPLFWATQLNPLGEVIYFPEEFLLKVLPAVSGRSASFYAERALDLSQRLDQMCAKERQFFAKNSQLPLLCLVMLMFVRREIMRGENIVCNIETVFSLKETARRLSQTSALEWSSVSTSCRQIVEGLLARSSWTVFCSAMQELLRSYHAKTLLEKEGDLLWSGYKLADRQRREGIIIQLESSLRYPEFSIRGYWYHWRSASLKRKLIEALWLDLYH